MIKQIFYVLLIISLLPLFMVSSVQAETYPDLSYTKSLTFNEPLLEFYSGMGEAGRDASGWITTFSSLFVGDMDSAFTSMEEMGIIRPQDLSFIEELNDETGEGNYSRVYELLGMDESNLDRLETIKEEIDAGNTKEAYELLQLDPDEITRLEEMVSEINGGNYDRMGELLPVLENIISALFQSGENSSDDISEKAEVIPAGEMSNIRDFPDVFPVGSDSVGLRPDGGEGYVYDAIHSSYDITSGGTYHLVQNLTVTDAPYAIRISADDVHLNGNMFGLIGYDHGTGIEVHGDRVSIENFNAITGFGTGVSSKKNNDLVISTCSLIDNMYGIQVSDADSARIQANAFYRNTKENIEISDVQNAFVEQNLVSTNAGGIILSGGKDAFVVANILSYNSGGITVSDYSFMNVTTNLLSYNSGGIVLSDAGTGEVTNNLLSYNTAGGVALKDVDTVLVRGNLLTYNENGGITVSGGESAIIMLNMMSNEGYGISVSGADRAGMYLNVLIACEKYGIEVSDVHDVAVHYNSLAFITGRAVSVSSAHQALIVCNTLAYNTGAVFISDIDELIFGSNTLSYNLGSAVEASRITNASVVTNTVAYNEKNGVMLSEIGTSEYERNVISYNGNNGLYVQDCDMTRIVENVLSYCNDNAIYLSGCTDVTLTDNVLYGNGNQIGIINSNGTVTVRKDPETSMNSSLSFTFNMTEGSLHMNPDELLSGLSYPQS